MEGTSVPARVLIVAGEDIEHEMEAESLTSIHRQRALSNVNSEVKNRTNIR